MGLCDCGCGHHPKKFKNTDLTSIDIGSRKQSDRGCGPDISGTQPGSCYAWCRKKGFEYPDNGEYQWGGRGDNCKLCTFDFGCSCSGKTGCCNVGGKSCTVKRTGYNGNPGVCCLIGGSGQTTGSNISDKDIDWSEIGETTYTCNSKITNPYQQDNSINCSSYIADICSVQNQSTWDQWDSTKKGKCVTWVNGAGSIYYSQASTVLQSTLQNFANKYKTVNQSSNPAAQKYLGEILDQCAKYAGSCDTQMKQLCSTLTRDDVLDAYGDLMKNQNSHNIVSACGCHLPDEQYTQYGQFGIDEKYYDSCDPLCKLNPAIPKATCDDKGACKPWPCEQTICIIDNVTIDIMNSDVSGGVNFNVTCGGCGKAGGCLCIFSDISVFSEASNFGGINFNVNCGGQCAIADPNKPGKFTYVDCDTGKPTGKSGSKEQKIWNWIKDHKRDVFFGVVILIFIIFLVLFIFFYEKHKKNSYDGSSTDTSMSDYFDQYDY